MTTARGVRDEDEAAPDELAEEKARLVLEAPDRDQRVPDFANFLNMSHGPHGFVLTFGYVETTQTAEEVEEGTVPVRIVSRTAVSPSFLLAAMRVMAEQYTKYQTAYPGLAPPGVQFEETSMEAEDDDAERESS